jgi:ankyrin repeat protein
MKSLEITVNLFLFALLFISCNTSDNGKASLGASTEQNAEKDSLALFSENKLIVNDGVENEGDVLGVTVAELDSIVDGLAVHNLEVPFALDLIYGTHIIKTDLLIAAFNSDKHYLVDRLIKEHAYVDKMSDSLKMMLLHVAVVGNSFKHIDIVIESGADLNFCFNGKHGLYGVIDRIIEVGSDETLDYLLLKGLSPNGCANKQTVDYHTPPIARAIMSQNFSVARSLIEHGADLEARYSASSEDCWPCAENITPMHELSMDWYPDDSIKHSIAEYVLRQYVLTDSPKKIEVLSEVLNYSSYNQDTTIVEMLIDRGAKIEFGGSSSLLSAVTFSNWTMVRKLLQNGADPNFFLKNQGTPAHVSLTCCGDGFGDGITKYSRVQTLRYLKMYGADFKTKYEVEGHGNFSVEDLMETRNIELD